MNDKKEKRLMTIVASVIVGLIALILIVMFCMTDAGFIILLRIPS